MSQSHGDGMQTRNPPAQSSTPSEAELLSELASCMADPIRAEVRSIRVTIYERMYVLNQAFNCRMNVVQFCRSDGMKAANELAKLLFDLSLSHEIFGIVHNRFLGLEKAPIVGLGVQVRKTNSSSTNITPDLIDRLVGVISDGGAS